MKAAGQSESRASPVDLPSHASAAIAFLERAGAGKYDPVHMHYLQVLARRAATHEGLVRSVLDGKLALALATFRARFEQALSHARDNIAQIAPQHPGASDDLQPLLDAGDLKGVRQFIAKLQNSAPHASLGDLTRVLADHAPTHEEAGSDGMLQGVAGLPPELKVTRYFRNTWSKLSMEKRLTQALHQAPKNAGPINSHSLVLRSLALMRDISPDYLNQLTSYVDTLICLDQSDQGKPAGAKKSADGKHNEKVRTRRATRQPP